MGFCSGLQANFRNGHVLVIGTSIPRGVWNMALKVPPIHKSPPKSNPYRQKWSIFNIPNFEIHQTTTGTVGFKSIGLFSPGILEIIPICDAHFFSICWEKNQGPFRNDPKFPSFLKILFFPAGKVLGQQPGKDGFDWEGVRCQPIFFCATEINFCKVGRSSTFLL